MDQLFKYRAVDATGKSSSGQLRAADAASAARELVRQGLTPLSIETVAAAATAKDKIKGRVTRRDLQVFLQELATLLKAGISLAEALPSLGQSYARHPLSPALQAANQKLRGGGHLSEALQHPTLPWPSYVLALMQAGEASGELAQSLAEAAEQLDHELTTAQELRNALIYPTILVLAGIVAVLVVFVGVVPKFSAMLKSSRADIPALSRWVIEAGTTLQQNLLPIGIGAALLVAVISYMLSQPAQRDRLLQWVARLPGIGDWLRSVDIGRWALVLGALLANRVAFVDAIRLSAGTLRIEQLRSGLLRAASQLQQGKALSEILEAQAWFPEMRLNLIRVGERSGELPRMLRSLGSMETQASRMLQKRVLALIEPIAILVIGAVIGVIMVAVMMAVTSLNTVAV